MPITRYEWITEKTYEEVWNYQTKLHETLIKAKKEKLSEEKPPLHHLLFCEHGPVYTLGKSGHPEHLLLSPEKMKEENIEFFKINRGGDITYHGPGQITGYPIFDLDCFYTDVHRYVRELEEVVILSLREYSIEGIRIPKYTGVWVQDRDDKKAFRKICAIGVHLSRWVTLHGFAFNVNTNLDYFNHIIPCGIREDELTVTSLEKEIGKKVDIQEMASLLKDNFAKIFNLQYV